mmetsp:Transcript_2109/g.2344  ORF Transcript_2109/g.2344 Transcript_2109/m.2344 type:complete len:189 (+) Transcript_2109:43-609(+)
MSSALFSLLLLCALSVVLCSNQAEDFYAQNTPTQYKDDDTSAEDFYSTNTPAEHKEEENTSAEDFYSKNTPAEYSEGSTEDFYANAEPPVQRNADGSVFTDDDDKPLDLHAHHAVKLHPDTDPHEFAREKGFHNLGQVGSIEHTYLFKLRAEHRNQVDAKEKIAALKNDERVHYHAIQVPQPKDKRSF